MSEPFLAEVRMVGFNFAPRGWAFCDGQILPIAQNQSLYALLGTMYGGDGRTSFALPDLRGRVPIHRGSSNGTNHAPASKGGEETHTLSGNEMPQHTHTIQASTDASTSQDPTNNVLAKSGQIYKQSTNLADMVSGTMTNTGGGQSHDNMQPYLVVNFCIAIQGLFPSRN
jgi:microcystin-dependent protein